MIFAFNYCLCYFFIIPLLLLFCYLFSHFILELLSNICRPYRKNYICSHAASEWRRILSDCPVAINGYCPPKWMTNSYINALAGLLWRGGKKLDLKRNFISLPDGGMLGLDEVNNNHCSKVSICLFLPGLTGDSNAVYIEHLACELSMKHRIFIMNYRGVNCELKTEIVFSATYTDDLHHVVRWIRCEYPSTERFYVIGNSLGGLVLSHYVSKTCSFIDVAFILSTPFDLNEMDRSLSYTINHYFFVRPLMKTLKAFINRYYNSFFRHLISRYQLNKCKTFKELNEKFTAPLFGYENYRDYCADALLRGKLTHIMCPTLFINSNDDIFSPLQSIPLQEIEKNINISLILTEGGGHSSFIQRNSELSYAESIVLEVIRLMEKFKYFSK
ncbi:hypothetical protein SNEBB_000829 [Seison nebaliae]|nr:hypothetical protein SNEBB_000829 [Seison nebaliae]